MRNNSIENLHLGITQLLIEAKLQQWTIQKTKMMLVNLFDDDSVMFWRRVYEEKQLDRDAGLVDEEMMFI